MEKKLQHLFMAVVLASFPVMVFPQTPKLGTTADFELFTSNGAVSNSGISQITGNVGTNSGASTAFGNVNGVMHDNDGASALCASDLLGLCMELDNAIPTIFPAPLLGGGQKLNAGVYSISAVTSLNDTLVLDGQGNSDAVFIFKIGAAFSTGAHAYVSLINGALANNVFWKIEGLVSLATGTTMRGTVIANNAAIEMNTGTILEGRALSTAGAITVDGVLAYTPVEADLPLSGPNAPNLASTACYALFSGNGEVTNSNVSIIKGDVGTNVGLTTGFDPLYVTGSIHPIPDVSTDACAVDLLNVYNYLNLLPNDIELLYPAQFGRNLVLTPHTYLLNAATTFTDSLYLNAEGNSNAIFVIKIKGALETSTYAKVLLINGTQAKNVYWNVDGAVDINNYSQFNGTIICNNGAININTGVTLNGRALTTDGALKTEGITATITSGCNSTGIVTPQTNKVVVFNPNDRIVSMVINMNDASDINGSKLVIYNSLGIQISSVPIKEKTTTFEVELPLGIYLYKLILNNGSTQSGKLISK